jgi:hypothetical protein
VFRTNLASTMDDPNRRGLHSRAGAGAGKMQSGVKAGLDPNHSSNRIAVLPKVFINPMPNKTGRPVTN